MKQMFGYKSRSYDIYNFLVLLYPMKLNTTSFDSHKGDDI